MPQAKITSDSQAPGTRERGLLTRAPLLVLLLLQSGCSLLGIRTTEEAEYTLLERDGRFELREYEPRVVAMTTVDADFDQAGNTAFRRLFAYISGANTTRGEIAMTSPVIAQPGNGDDSTEIAMTAPVIGEPGEQGWRFAFVLPSTFTADSAPRPTDDAVRLEAEPRRTVAAVRYSGRWRENHYRRERAALEDWLRGRGLAPASTPRAAAYDPPWALPFLRRNEVLIDIES